MKSPLSSPLGMNPAVSHRQVGGALVMVVVTVLMIMMFAGVTMTVVNSHGREHSANFEKLRCLYLAETAVEQANIDLNTGGDGNMGTQVAPMDYSTGEVWVTSTPDGLGNFVIEARARMNNVTQSVTAITGPTQHVFHHAVFAGNSSSDPNYILDFGGSAEEADHINGNIYSGQDIDVREDAIINGEVRATGTITGAVPASHQGPQPLPDFASMNYAVNHNVDVVAEFDNGASPGHAPAGGNAWQLPKTSPAHVFRKNPSDRGHLHGPTKKDDYFLEDPYEAADRDEPQDGTNPSKISFDTGAGASNEHDIVFYIDGNLWVTNIPTYSFTTAHTPDGTRVTFAVKGNIYIGDNIFYGNPEKDGIAFVALKDPDEADSGNIYFGDPRAGTLNHMHAFMYAENNFYDNNLSTSSSAIVNLNGTMSAGNQVLIERDFENQHTKLNVNYDARLERGELTMPGIPGAGGANGQQYQIKTWIHDGRAGN